MANFIFLNPLDKDSTITLYNDNLTITKTSTTSNYAGIRSNVLKITGKYYWEITISAGSNSDGLFVCIGIASSEASLSNGGNQAQSGALTYYNGGYKESESSQITYGDSFTVGDTIGVAVDLDNKSLTFYKNGTSQGVAFTTEINNLISGGGVYPFIKLCDAYTTNISVTSNFGSTTFKYAIPSGYKALDVMGYMGKAKTFMGDVKNIGDYISCRYTAPISGQVGYFSELGTTSTPPIPPEYSSATPDGSFYWIYVGVDYLGRKKFIADRNIQHSISWNALNNAGMCSENSAMLEFTNDLTNISGENILSNSYYPETSPLNLFDNTEHSWATLVGNNGWVSYEFKESKKIQMYTLQSVSFNEGLLNRSPKDWVFEAWDGEKWVLLDKRTNQVNWKSGEIRRYTFNNINQYRQYRINISENCGGDLLQFREMEMMESYSGKNYYFSIRLLTGGISQDDKDNEWDKIICESTLKGLITAGDNDVWNGREIYSLTSTSLSNDINGYRVNRTNPLYSHHLPSHEDSQKGFRPVLLVETLSIDKFLIRQSPHYYSLKPEYYDVISHNYTPLLLKGGDKPNKEDIDLFGFDDINSLIKLNTNEADNFVPLDKFNSPEIIAYII